MEVERTKYETTYRKDAKGGVSVVGERQVGKTEKFEFGAPDDDVSAAVGGSYIMQWNPDFLQKELGKDGVCMRYYFDKKMVVDVGDPESSLSKKKRRLMYQAGFGYLCIPTNFTHDVNSMRDLYKAAIAEYYAYEKLHPRPLVIQEATIIDREGKVRLAKIRAIDIKVGGGLTVSQEMQEADLKAAKPLGSQQIKLAKAHTKAIRAVRRARQKGVPFRNPFVAPGKRQYRVEYSQ